MATRSPQVLISPDTLTASFPDVPRLRFGLRLPRTERRHWQRDLIAEFGLPAGLDHRPGKPSRRLSLDIFERTFTVTAALNVLTLGVAGLAIFASLLTLSGMRLPQMAPLWAMGLTRRRLAALDLLRTRAAGAPHLVAAAAARAGAGLGAAGGDQRRRPSAGGCRCTSFPPTGCGSAVWPLWRRDLQALVPALRLARLAPADLLRVFSNER